MNQVFNPILSISQEDTKHRKSAFTKHRESAFSKYRESRTSYMNYKYTVKAANDKHQELKKVSSEDERCYSPPCKNTDDNSVINQNNLLEENTQVIEQQQKNKSKHQELYYSNTNYKSIYYRLKLLLAESERLQEKSANLLFECYGYYLNCKFTEDKLASYKKYIELKSKQFEVVLETLSQGNAFMRFYRHEKFYETIKKKYVDPDVSDFIDMLVNKPIEEPKKPTTLRRNLMGQSQDLIKQLQDYLILQISARSRNYYYRSFYKLKSEFEEL